VPAVLSALRIDHCSLAIRALAAGRRAVAATSMQRREGRAAHHTRASLDRPRVPLPCLLPEVGIQASPRAAPDARWPIPEGAMGPGGPLADAARPRRPPPGRGSISRLLDARPAVDVRLVAPPRRPQVRHVDQRTSGDRAPTVTADQRFVTLRHRGKIL
jgi:hypothetical protein